jgi:8-oxo-dGTP pyrophosphatase MutT (NUDIX family)
MLQTFGGSPQKDERCSAMIDAGSFHRLMRAAWPWRRADRVQVAALPWRRRADGGIEIMLITSRGTGQWIVPKGGMMPGKTPAEAAAIEAWEEAGVRGRIETAEAGRFTHLKTRLVGPPLHCRVTVYRLEVERELMRWPERRLRSRRWFTLDEAEAAVRSKELRAIIRALAVPAEAA